MVDLERRQGLAAPVQLAPNVVRPKSRTVSANRRPLPSCPRMFSAGTTTRYVVHMEEGYAGMNVDRELASYAGRDTRTISLFEAGTRAMIASRA